MNRPSLVSFFHGVGGMSKGAHKAGFETVYASDMWKAAKQAFEDNNCEGYFDLLDFFKNTGKNIFDKIFENSVRTFNYRDIDSVVSGSPCQGMSGVNPNRATYNFKNMLMMKQIRIAGMQGLGAKTAWFEQVPGFLDKPMRSLRNEVLAVLDAQTDYNYEIRVLNALDYGSYQSRDRVTILMVRKDVGEPSFPVAQPIDLSKSSLQAALPYIKAFKYKGNQAAKTAHDNVINTMTASGDGLLVFDGKEWRSVSSNEKQILSHLDGYNLSRFKDAEKTKLMGNMVQIPFAEAIMKHIHHEILMKSSVYNKG